MSASEVGSGLWYRCPKCGLAKAQQGDAASIQGTSIPTAFMDGRGGWARQQRLWTLLCPCGHDWQLLETATRERGGAAWEVVRAPFVPEPASESLPEAIRVLRDRGLALYRRRVRLALSLRQAGEGLGLRASDVSSLERGSKQLPDLDAQLARYEAWLSEQEASRAGSD